MARPRSPAIAARDDEIYVRWKSGRYTLADLAEMYGRTPQRIGQILATRHPEHEDETSRALHRGRLEVLITEIQGVVESPGVKLAPNGRVAEDGEGNPIEDTSAKIEALKVLLIALKSARELDGLDKPQRRQLQITHELATSQAALDIARRRAEMEALARRAGQQPPVVRGEVLGELPPAQEAS